MIKYILTLSFGLIMLYSCKKDKVESTEEPSVEKQIKLSMQPKFGIQNLLLDSVYELDNGTLIQISDIKMYFSDIKSSGNVVKDIALFDYRANGKLVFSAKDLGVDLNSLAFGVGVPSSLNHNDPSAFSSSNPLNILIANDMHWDWNPGYVFFKMEGKADTLVDGNANFNLNLSYHLGMDANFSSKTVSGINWSSASNSIKEASLKLDIQQFFQNPTSPILVKTENQTHSMPNQQVLTEKVKNNLLEAIHAL